MDSPLYNSLDPTRQEIRLLIIEPDGDEDTIPSLKCQLITDSLLQAQHPYYAVSYVWGDPTDTEPVYIDGHECQATINLVAFLRWYRTAVVAGRTWPPHPIWVDALCIDQRSVLERNNQVLMMASIYRAAERTFAWLGPAADDTDFAMRNLVDMSLIITKHAEQVPSGSDRWSNPLDWLAPDHAHWFRPDYDRGDGGWAHGATRNRFWRGAAKLLRRPYWTRAWVTQELILSDSIMVLCGTSFAPFWSFTSIALWLRIVEGLHAPHFVDEMLWRELTTAFGRSTLGWTLVLNLLRVEQSRQLQTEETEGNLSGAHTWRRLVIDTLPQQASDPRDKLYSVLGLLKHAVRPDYSLSTEAVYCDFAKLCIRSDTQPDFMLVYAGHGLFLGSNQTASEFAPHMLFVPSWVPNWDLISKEPELLYMQQHLLSLRLDGDRFPRCQRPFWGFEGGALLVDGRQWDRVVMCRKATGAHERVWDSFCETIIAKLGDEYVTGKPILQALTRLLLMDRNLRTGELLGKHPDPELIVKLGVFALAVYPGNTLAAGRPDRFGLRSIPAAMAKFLGDAIHLLSDETFKRTEAWLRVVQTGNGLPNVDRHESFLRFVDVSLGGWSVEEVYNHIGKLFRHNAVFVTNSGYLGWAPLGLQAGDLICILENDLPVVLRNVGSHYLHIGACFVLGLEEKEELAVAKSAAGRHTQQFRIV